MAHHRVITKTGTTDSPMMYVMGPQLVIRATVASLHPNTHSEEAAIGPHVFQIPPCVAATSENRISMYQRRLYTVTCHVKKIYNIMIVYPDTLLFC